VGNESNQVLREVEIREMQGNLPDVSKLPELALSAKASHEALEAINQADIPYLVAITKIDKSNADVEHTKSSLLGHGIYLEGMGGSVPYMPISSKTGEGIPALLDLLLLAADLEELAGDPTKPATGLVIESRCDPRRGISATLIIKDGSLTNGQYVVAGSAYAPLRIVEDFQGNTITNASFSSPVMVVGFSDNPTVGAPFVTVDTKKEAVARAKEYATPAKAAAKAAAEDGERFVLPVVLKSDVEGSLDAIKHELKKLEDERTGIWVIHEGVGSITEGDVKLASGNKDALIIGFNVATDLAATEVAERLGIEVATFTIIYDLADWLLGAIDARRPAVHGEHVLGTATVLKTFSFSKKAQTLGCRVQEGELSVKDRVRLLHKDEEVGTGRISSLKSGKSSASRAPAPCDCGMVVEMHLESEPVYGDTLVAFTVTEN